MEVDHIRLFPFFTGLAADFRGDVLAVAQGEAEEREPEGEEEEAQGDGGAGDGGGLAGIGLGVDGGDGYSQSQQRHCQIYPFGGREGAQRIVDFKSAEGGPDVQEGENGQSGRSASGKHPGEPPEETLISVKDDARIDGDEGGHGGKLRQQHQRGVSREEEIIDKGTEYHRSEEAGNASRRFQRTEGQAEGHPEEDAPGQQIGNHLQRE